MPRHVKRRIESPHGLRRSDETVSSSVARIPAVEVPKVGSELATMYEAIVAAGFGNEAGPINWFKCLAGRPDLLRATWAIVEAVIVEGLLPPTLKQMVILVISRQNNCRYCSVTHLRALEALGVPADTINSCVSDPEFSDVPEPHRTVLRFALNAASAPQLISDSDVDALRACGFDDDELSELFLIIAIAGLANTWADLAGIPLDD